MPKNLQDPAAAGEKVAKQKSAKLSRGEFLKRTQLSQVRVVARIAVLALEELKKRELKLTDWAIHSNGIDVEIEDQAGSFEKNWIHVGKVKN